MLRALLEAMPPQGKPKPTACCVSASAVRLLAKRDLLDLCMEGLATHLASSGLRLEASLLQVWSYLGGPAVYVVAQNMNIGVHTALPQAWYPSGALAHLCKIAP